MIRKTLWGSFAVLVIALALVIFLPDNGKAYIATAQWTNINNQDLTWYRPDGGFSCEDALLISSDEQFASIQNFVNTQGQLFENRYIRLTTDINTSRFSWPPIGNMTTRPFRGTFDGNGHVITLSNFTSGLSQPSLGLFGNIENATIKNLTLDGAVTTISTAAGTGQLVNMGALVGIATNSTIDNVTNNAWIGLNRSSVLRLGGIIGLGIDTTIRNTINTAHIGSTGGNQQHFLGGIAGLLEGESLLYNIANFGRIAVEGTHQSKQVAGIVANVNGLINAKNIANYGEIHYRNNSTTMSATSAGIFGRMQSGSLVNAYNRGNFTGNIWMGVGLIHLVASPAGGAVIINGAYNLSNRERLFGDSMSGGSGTRILPIGSSMFLSHVFSTGSFSSVNNIDTDIVQVQVGTISSDGDIQPSLLSRMRTSLHGHYWIEGVRENGVNVPTLNVTRRRVRVNFVSSVNASGMPISRYEYMGTMLFRQSDPTAERHTFLRWGVTSLFSTTEFEFSVRVVHDVTIYAVWRTDLVQITFNTYGGTEIPNQYIVPGTSPTMPQMPPTRDRHTFVRWGATANAATAFNFNTIRNADVTVYAVWSLANSRISFDTGGGSIIEDMYTADTIFWVSDIPTPTKQGYAFMYWTLDSSMITWSFSLNPRRDVTLVAVWQSAFTVIFDVRGTDVEVPSAQYIPAFGKAFSPILPDVDSNTLFRGWSMSSGWFEPFYFGQPITQDWTLFAFWAVRGEDFSHIVYLNFQNGEENERRILNTWSNWISEPQQPTHSDNLRFRWWSTRPNGAAFDFYNDRITSDTTLYAVWYTPYNSVGRIVMIVGISVVATVAIIANALYIAFKLKKP